MIEKVCRTFLWTEGTEESKKALVAWETMCKPKAAGELNLLNVEAWNKTAICKLMWNLCKKKDRLWVQWVHVYYKKQIAGWNIEAKQASWIIQKIFKARQYFKEAGYNEDDMEKMESFSVKKFYTKLSEKFERVTWRKLMQRNLEAPKWKFIIYLAAQRKLVTKDRLRGLGYVEEVTCELCNKEEESIDHLFFSCPYTSQVWTVLLQWQGICRKAMQWNEELSWTISCCKGRSIKPELYRLILVGAVYHVWQERNNRIFRGVKQSIQELVRDIVQAVYGRGRCIQRLQARLDEMNYYPT